MANVDSIARPVLDSPKISSPRAGAPFILAGCALSILSVLGFAAWTYGWYYTTWPCPGYVPCGETTYLAMTWPFEPIMLALVSVPALAVVHPRMSTRLIGEAGALSGIVLIWAITLGLAAWYGSAVLGHRMTSNIVSPGVSFWPLVILEMMGATLTILGLSLGKGPAENRSFSLVLATFPAAIALVFGGFSIAVAIRLVGLDGGQYVAPPALFGGLILVGGVLASLLLALRAVRQARKKQAYSVG
jgi:hypothetical protein